MRVAAELHPRPPSGTEDTSPPASHQSLEDRVEGSEELTDSSSPEIPKAKKRRYKGSLGKIPVPAFLQAQSSTASSLSKVPPPLPPPSRPLIPSRVSFPTLLSISPKGAIVISKDLLEVAPNFGVLKAICGQWAQLCCPGGQLDGNNVQRLRYVLMSLVVSRPGLAVFNKVPIFEKYDMVPPKTLFPQWDDFCHLMASLPAIEIFVPQALGVLAALSEVPQGGEQPRHGQQCEMNLPKLLEVLQQAGLGDAGMQILTELFTPHFQSSGVGVVDLMCTCHALVNYELMTHPTRLACALVNTTTNLPARGKPFSAGIKPLGYGLFLYLVPPGRGAPPSSPPGSSRVDQLVAILYQKGEEGSHQAVVGRDPTKILKTYLGLLDEDPLPSDSSKLYSFTVNSASQGIVYALSLETVALIRESRNTGIATFHCLAPDDVGNLSCPGHTCLALKTQSGDIIFHTNYQNPNGSVFYVGITGEGVFTKFSLEPDRGFKVQEPYMLSTHTTQAHHGALAHLEYASPQNTFLQEAYRQFSQCQGPGLAEIPNLINQCGSDPTKIHELMPQIFQKLQPTLEILSPPEPLSS
jgi:hypothetical protein